MLSKENRLRKEKDFKLVYLLGKTFRNDFFITKILENKNNVNRFGIVVSNKVSKKATKRNKLKRRIREIIRSNENNFKKGFDVIIIAKISSLEKNFSELKKNLIEIFLASKILKK